MNGLLSSEIVVLGCAFLSVVIIAFWVMTRMRPDPAARRIKQLSKAKGRSGAVAVSIVHTEIESPFLRFLEPLQKAIAQSDPRQVGLARQKLIQAGFYRQSAVDIYFTSRLVLGVLGAIASGLYVLFLAPEMQSTKSLLTMIGSATLGYYLPAIIVSSRVSERQKAFRLGMPDALDMLLVGIEGGLSLQAAMRHVSDRFADTHPIVAEQFQTVTLEFQAGRSRAEALRALANRMDVPETRTLASMIVQSEALGTSLSQTLRVMAEEMRTTRMLKAEKTASELPVKMSIPLVTCIFPATMAVALVPALLSTLAFFAEISGGG